MNYSDRSPSEWDKELSFVTQHHYHDEARKLYTEGKIKDGELFFIEGGKIKVGAVEKDAWVLATFIANKLVRITHSVDDRRLPRLKRLAIAKLLDVIERGWVDTKQTTMTPPRFQNLKDPDLIIYGANSKVTDFESIDARKEKKIFDESAPLEA